jgi:hypothetical protein
MNDTKKISEITLMLHIMSFSTVPYITFIDVIDTEDFKKFTGSKIQMEFTKQVALK